MASPCVALIGGLPFSAPEYGVVTLAELSVCVCVCPLAVTSRPLATVRCLGPTKCCAGDQIKEKETGTDMYAWETREVERPDGRRQLGRPRHRWDDSTKMKLQKVGWKKHGLD